MRGRARPGLKAGEIATDVEFVSPGASIEILVDDSVGVGEIFEPAGGGLLLKCPV